MSFDSQNPSDNSAQAALSSDSSVHGASIDPTQRHPRAPGKRCCDCGIDVENRVRYKDAYGRYRCRECEAMRRENAVPLAPRTDQPGSQPALVRCQACSNAYPAAMLATDEDGKRICPMCAGAGRELEGLWAYLAGLSGIALLAAAPLLLFFLPELINARAGLMATGFACVAGAWLTYLGRGLAANSSGGARGTLRAISIAVTALYATLAIVKCFGPFLLGDASSGAGWMVRVEGFVFCALLLVGFLKLRPPAGRTYQFQPDSLGNLAAIGTALLLLIGLVVVSLQEPTSSGQPGVSNPHQSHSDTETADAPRKDLRAQETANSGPSDHDQKQSTPKSAAQVQGGDPTSPTVVSRQVITASTGTLAQADVDRWASQFEQDADRDPDHAFAEHFDEGQFFAITAENLNLSGEQVEQGMLLCSRFSATLVDIGKLLVRHRPVKVLNTKHVGGCWQATVRVLLTTGGQDYLRLTIGANNSGSPCIVDLESISDGGTSSEICRAILLSRVVVGDPIASKSLGDRDQMTLDHHDAIEQIYTNMQANDLTEASHELADLPTLLRQAHQFAVLPVRANIDAGKSDFENAVKNALTMFPDDPTVHYIRYQRAYQRKQYDLALAALDDLNRAVGSDPFILALRANVQLRAQRPVEARASAKQATAREPSLTLPHWELVQIDLAEGKYAEVRQQLQTLENDLGETIPQIEHDAAFAGFVASLEYPAWKAGRTPALSK